MDAEDRDYVDSVCECCGQKIEFPMDGQGDTAPCPACGKEIRLFVREASIPEPKIIVPALYKELPPIFRHIPQVHHSPATKTKKNNRLFVPLLIKAICKESLRWALVLPAAILGGFILMLLSGLLCLFAANWFTAIINSSATASAFVFAGAMTAPRFRMAVAILLSLLMGFLYVFATILDWPNNILLSDRFDSSCCLIGVIFGVFLGCLGVAGEKK